MLLKIEVCLSGLSRGWRWQGLSSRQRNDWCSPCTPEPQARHRQLPNPTWRSWRYQQGKPYLGGYDHRQLHHPGICLHPRKWQRDMVTLEISRECLDLGYSAILRSIYHVYSLLSSLTTLLTSFPMPWSNAFSNYCRQIVKVHRGHKGSLVMTSRQIETLQ